MRSFNSVRHKLLRAALSMGFACLAGQSLIGQCTTQWLPGDGLAGVSGVVHATACWDPDGTGPLNSVIVVGGEFSVAGATFANNVAVYDLQTNQWSPLGTGTDGAVLALTARPNGDLIVGGSFTIAGGVSAARVARWSGTSWYAMGGGMNADVRALVSHPNGDVFAGGSFVSSGGIPTNGIARWDGTAWSAVGGGISGSVNALALMNGDLIAGGSFGIASVAAWGIARWDGSAWFPLGTGISQCSICVAAVNSIIFMADGSLIAGGRFDSAGGVTARNIARWDGSAWTSIGDANTGVQSLAILPAGDLVAAGYFTTIGGASCSRIARWDGASWQALGTGIESSGTPYVASMTVTLGGDLVVGGAFLRAGNAGASMVALWNGAAWLPVGNGGPDSSVYAGVALPNGDVVIGGRFTGCGGVIANRIAVRRGGNWLPMGSGMNNSVFALLALPNGDLVAGGDFTIAGNGAANRIARWDGVGWSPLGSGLGSTVRDLVALPNGDIIAAGSFTAAGGVSANRIARWDGTTWLPMGAGLASAAHAMAILDNGDIIVGGSFGMAGGISASRVARWDGLAWSALGAGVDGSVKALAVLSNGWLAAGGDFQNAGGRSARGIALWNGSSWSPLGTGVTGGLPYLGSVFAIAPLPDGGLIAGGRFTTAGAQGANSIARWDGFNWSSLGSGLGSIVSPVPASADVNAVAVVPSGEIAVGGAFGTANGTPSPFFARLATTCPATVLDVPAGCNPSVPLDLDVIALPWLGGTYEAVGSGFAPGALGVDVLGLSASALPLSALLPIGWPGCLLLASTDLTQSLLPVSGVATVRFSLPATPALAGASLRHQMLAVEFGAQAQPTALVASNALVLTLGWF